MRDLPEICEFCRREVEALERVIALSTREERRVASVSFRESVEGVYCMGCAGRLAQGGEWAMYRTGSKPVRGHAVQDLSVVEIPHRLRGSARVLCDAFGIEVWGLAEFEQERGMLEREILAFACPTCGRGLVVDLMASRIPQRVPDRVPDEKPQA